MVGQQMSAAVREAEEESESLMTSEKELRMAYWRARSQMSAEKIALDRETQGNLIPFLRLLRRS